MINEQYKQYSQDGQDIYLQNTFFKDKTDGFYVDIGAHDGISLSNTYIYEKLGWSGICIEPLPEIYNLLTLNRSCKCINGVVSDINTPYVDFCYIKGAPEMLSGIIENYTEKHKLRIIEECKARGSSKQKIKVKNYNFSEVINNVNINFLDIDTEGNELNILKTVDYNKYNIQVIAAEDNIGTGELQSFLISKGFNYITRVGGDCIFYNPNFIHNI